MSVSERLTAWTALALISFVITGWALASSWRRWYLTQGRPTEVRFVLLVLMVKDALMLLTWSAILGVGALGYVSPTSEYRSWGMLLAVIFLGAHQMWSTWGWRRVMFLAEANHD